MLLALIWPLGHLLLDSTGLDGPPKLKALVMLLALETIGPWPPDFTSGPPKFVGHWPRWATNFQNDITGLLLVGDKLKKLKLYSRQQPIANGRLQPDYYKSN